MRVRLLLFTLAAAALSATFTVGGFQSVHAGGPCASGFTVDEEESQFLELINDYRSDRGLSRLALSDTLTRAAAWKSAHMANNDYFGHDDQGLGRDFVGRLRDCGYTANTWLAENIAAGNASAEATFEQWRNSPGHNANMLNTNLRAIGIARAHNTNSSYGWYWTTEFGGVSDGSSAPPPASRPENSGDVDCRDGTTSVDAVLVLQLAAGLLTSLPCSANGDMDGDGRMGAADAAIILQVAAGYFG